MNHDFLHRPAARLLGTLAICLGVAPLASAGLIASFENDAEGWTINAAENAAYSITGFSTTEGVTDGTYSMIVEGTAAPSYGQLLVSPASTTLTAELANAMEVSIDVTAAPGAFDWGSQWSAVINNADLGYTSLDGFGYSGFIGPGASGTLTWALTAAQRATLAGSAADSTLIFQVGGGGPGTAYVDNVRTTEVPEPTALALLTLAAATALRGRRR